MSRGLDYGFFALSTQDQAALRELFDYSSRDLPYLVTHELVQQAQKDSGLVDHLKRQFENTNDRYFGFYDLSADDQAILRELFGDKAHLLPYRLTSELITMAEDAEELKLALIAQFEHRGWSRRRDNNFGFEDLSKVDQQRLRALFGAKSRVLPHIYDEDSYL